MRIHHQEVEEAELVQQAHLRSDSISEKEHPSCTKRTTYTV